MQGNKVGHGQTLAKLTLAIFLSDFGQLWATLSNFTCFGVVVNFLTQQAQPQTQRLAFRPGPQTPSQTPNRGEGARLYPCGPVGSLHGGVGVVVVVVVVVVVGSDPRTTLPQTTGRRTPRTAQNFALFFPLPHPFSLFSSLSLWVSFREILVVFYKTGQMWMFGLSGFRVKPLRLRGQIGPHNLPLTTNIGHNWIGQKSAITAVGPLRDPSTSTGQTNDAKGNRPR